jgi:hypothetical protein
LGAASPASPVAGRFRSGCAREPNQVAGPREGHRANRAAVDLRGGGANEEAAVEALIPAVERLPPDRRLLRRIVRIRRNGGWFHRGRRGSAERRIAMRRRSTHTPIIREAQCLRWQLSDTTPLGSRALPGQRSFRADEARVRGCQGPGLFPARVTARHPRGRHCGFERPPRRRTRRSCHHQPSRSWRRQFVLPRSAPRFGIT